VDVLCASTWVSLCATGRSVTTTPSTKEHLVASNQDLIRTSIRQPFPTGWFPTGWSGPTEPDTVVAWLAANPDSDRLAVHFDDLYDHAPRTRDVLVAASAASRAVPYQLRDDFITELYLVYAELHRQPRDRIVRRAAGRAGRRVQPGRADANAVPVAFTETSTTNDDRVATHTLGWVGDQTRCALHPTRPYLAVVGAASQPDLATAVVTAIDAANALAAFRTAVLDRRPGAWPALHALLTEELTGQRLPTHPGRHTARARRRCADLAALTLRS
jgi:hypothetical protein